MTVSATIAHLAPSPVRPRADSENPGRTMLPIVEVPVRVEDARQFAPSLAAEGFELIRHRSRVTDFSSAEELDAVYLPEAEEIVKGISGAAHAWALPRPVLRSSNHGAGGGTAIRDGTAPIAHVDYSNNSVDLLIAAAEARRGQRAPHWKRLAVYTLWRSLRAPPQERPLALCDLQTIDAADLAAADAVGNPGALAHTAEFLLLVANKRHRWCYFPDVVPEEVVIFKQLDTALPGPSGCPHSSFAAPAGGTMQQRLSVEVRVCALWE